MFCSSLPLLKHQMTRVTDGALFIWIFFDRWLVTVTRWPGWPEWPGWQAELFFRELFLSGDFNLTHGTFFDRWSLWLIAWLTGRSDGQALTDFTANLGVGECLNWGGGGCLLSRSYAADDARSCWVWSILTCAINHTLTCTTSLHGHPSSQRTRAIDPMLTRRRRRWANIKPAFCQCLVLSIPPRLLTPWPYTMGTWACLCHHWHAHVNTSRI